MPQNKAVHLHGLDEEPLSPVAIIDFDCSIAYLGPNERPSTIGIAGARISSADRESASVDYGRREIN